MLRINPPPTDAELAAVYRDGYFESWGAADAARTLKLATFGRLLSLLPGGGTLLDVGTGKGLMMEAAEAAGFTAYGIELIPEAAAEAARRHGADRVFAGPFESATFPGVEQFDHVAMIDFIEHVRDPIAVVRKARALLRPGGTLLITTPDADSLSRRVLRGRWPHFHLQHLYTFNRRSIVNLLHRTGFAVRRIAPASKALSLDFIAANLRAWSAARGAAATLEMLPSRVRRRPLWLLSGQMEVLAVRA